MRIITILKDIRKNEDGAFLGTAIVLVIVIAIIAVFVLDGASAYYTWQSANNTTEEATRLAKLEYNDSRSDVRAEDAAADYCEANGMVFEKFTVNRYGHSFDIACSKDASTIVFKYLPVFRDLIHQEANKSTSNL